MCVNYTVIIITKKKNLKKMKWKKWLTDSGKQFLQQEQKKLKLSQRDTILAIISVIIKGKMWTSKYGEDVV